MLRQAADQAESLRQWALEQSRNRQELLQEPPAAQQLVGQTGQAPKISALTDTLVVAGVPGSGNVREVQVRQRLQLWSDRGASWAGETSEWEIFFPDSPVSVVASRRWALWVGSDMHAFDHCYQALRELGSMKSPRQVLALHDPALLRQGLLSNLVSTAQGYFGIELVLPALNEISDARSPDLKGAG